MKFEYTGRHLDVTPTLRTHVEDHFSKIEHIFDDSTARAHVIIEVNKNRHIGEVVLHWREHTLTATDTNADMYQALSRAIAKIEKQAVKLKKKIIERSHGGQPLSSLTPIDGDGRAVEAAPDDARRIINARRYTVKPMTAEEAALRLSGEADQFLVFRDADTSRVSVLYKRKDGNYGLIQP
ncbi:MAG: ribosome-associated translation inhibitor RaiA [Acidobacteriota bacterium]|nr:ribosome-associated translation inhibitor RaiA [Acidobacteriota bacterium]